MMSDILEKRSGSLEFEPVSALNIRSLRSQISARETELAVLRSQLHDLESQNSFPKLDLPLELQEYKRYSRQMLVPQIGLKGQMKLKNAAVLIIGAGGLGCPAATYLAGAGIGRLGFVDGDTIDRSNLHRQTLYQESDIGALKVDCMKKRLTA
jgi:adenylyltransferase/sulfurtransferase